MKIGSLLLICTLLYYIQSQQQQTIDNDQDFLTNFNIIVLKRNTSSTIYPKEGDQLLVHYHAMTSDMKVFDSSLNRRKPFSYPFGSLSVIRCWNECFKRMTIGDKVKATCPPTYGYGKTGVGSAIPPNSILIIEFELLGIGESKQPQEYIDDL